ncbi:MAG: prolyl oligopeptidase family serine peptidase [Bacteroidales bacterium]|nr:prolyl oligopeptidase family serine peptidase [Bacteroidales bacterium]
MYRFLTYLPDNYKADLQKYPLILFLHGAPQRGSNIEVLKDEALPKELENGLNIPFIVVAPHCPIGESWDPQKLYDFYNEMLKLYRIDKNRVYITGFSMGGFGLLKFVRDYPGLFAAAAPVCSGGSKYFAETIASVPMWFFHGQEDKVIDIENTRELVEELKKFGADIDFTIYPDLAHDVWTPTYKKPELYDWFLKYSH